jgi:serine/threonine protein phosphatase PrpC
MEYSGHGGIETAEFTARSLPGHIYAALQALNLLPDGFDPKGNHEYHARISALLNEIEKFDREIGEAVTALCKDPRKVTEANARLLIETHSEVLSRAYHGTTLTVALINNTQEDLWVANIGDSTVGASADCHFASLRLITSVHDHVKQCKRCPVRTPMVPEAGKDYWNCTLQPHLPNISGYQ